MPLQNKILLAGVAILLLLALVVPWQVNGKPAGYRPIFWGPEGSSHIDLTRLLIPVVAVGVATTMGIYLTRNNQHSGVPSQPTQQPTSAAKETQAEIPHPEPALINPHLLEHSKAEAQEKVTFGSERGWGLICALVVSLLIGGFVLSFSTKRHPQELKPGDTLPPGLSKLDRTVRALPEVTLVGRSDEKGELHGTVHNDTPNSLGMLKLVIKTTKWQREFRFKVYVAQGATEKFAVFVGDALLDVESFEVVEAMSSARVFGTAK